MKNASSRRRDSNLAATVDAPIARLFAFGCHVRRAPEPRSRAMKGRIPFRALLSALTSVLSLAAFTYLAWPRRDLGRMLLRPGPDPRELAATVWVLGLIVGGLLGIWALRSEAKLPARIAGFPALVALLPFLCVLVLIR